MEIYTFDNETKYKKKAKHLNDMFEHQRLFKHTYKFDNKNELKLKEMKRKFNQFGVDYILNEEMPRRIILSYLLTRYPFKKPELFEIIHSCISLQKQSETPTSYENSVKSNKIKNKHTTKNTIDKIIDMNKNKIINEKTLHKITSNYKAKILWNIDFHDFINLLFENAEIIITLIEFYNEIEHIKKRMRKVRINDIIQYEIL